MSETDNTNIIKEALKPCPFCGGEAVMVRHLGADGAECKACACSSGFFMADNGKEKAIKAWNTRTPEDLEIRYHFPQSVIDDLKSAVKIFGSLSAEQDEQLGLKGGGYMSLESLLRRAETLPEGQEMWAVENKEQIIGVEVEPFRADMRADNMQSFNPEFGPYKVVAVIVTKKED